MIVDLDSLRMMIASAVIVAIFAWLARDEINDFIKGHIRWP
jgi:hypothetical protein